MGDRGKSNSGAVGWINLLLGWSVIGWIIALVMACGAHRVRHGAMQVAVAHPGYQPPRG